MDVEVNIVGVAVAAVVAMLIGGVWYSPKVFGDTWADLAKIDKKRAKKDGPQAMVVMFVLALIAAYVLAYMTFVVGAWLEEETYMRAAVKTAVMVWLGFVVYGQASGALFEQRRKKLIALNLGNSLVTFIAMGVAIGQVGL